MSSWNLLAYDCSEARNFYVLKLVGFPRHCWLVKKGLYYIIALSRSDLNNYLKRKRNA